MTSTPPTPQEGPPPGGQDHGRGGTHHDAGEKTDTFPTVCVGHHVSIANGKERDGDEPHGTQKVTSYVLLVMVPAEGRQELVCETPIPGNRGCVWKTVWGGGAY